VARQRNPRLHPAGGHSPQPPREVELLPRRETDLGAAGRREDGELERARSDSIDFGQGSHEGRRLAVGQRGVVGNGLDPTRRWQQRIQVPAPRCWVFAGPMTLDLRSTQDKL
jgi:hypothetical protein